MIFQGVYLLFPDSAPWSRVTGGVLVAAGVVAAIIYARGMPALLAPSPVKFFIIALMISLLAAVSQRYFSNILVCRRGGALANKLDDFAQISQARLGHKLGLYTSEEEAKQHELHDEYLSRFGEDIRSVHRSLTSQNRTLADLLDSMLGSLPTRTLRLPELAKWTANILRRDVENHPRFWIDKRLFVTGAIYIGSATMLWLALFLLGNLCTGGCAGAIG